MHKRAYPVILVAGLLLAGGLLTMLNKQPSPALPTPASTAIPTDHNAQVYRTPAAIPAPTVALTPLAQVIETVQALPPAIATAIAPPPYLPTFPPAPTPLPIW